MKNTKDNIIMFTKPYSKEIDKKIIKSKTCNNMVIKKNSLRLNMSLYIAFSIFITVVLAYTAFLERGYFAMGGEYIFLILLPIGVCKILAFDKKQENAVNILEHRTRNRSYYKVS